MSVELYGDALLGANGPLRAEYDDGAVEELDVARWLGSTDAADRRLLRDIDGPTLDVGCGPGRLAAALTARGVEALGLDIAPAAVFLARNRGADVLRSSVFDPVPGEGRWAHVLLIDGNVGIGGDPVRLLRRARELLRTGGMVHVEVGSAGSRHGAVRTRLRNGTGLVGDWFGWAHVSACHIQPLATHAGLTMFGLWETDGRWFAQLRA